MFVNACSGTKSDLLPIGHVTLVKVTKNEKEIRPAISDPQTIQRIVEFVDAHNHGWEEESMFGPSPPVNIDLYDGADLKASFGCGGNFFKAQRRDEFWSKAATSDQVGQFLDLFGIPKEQLGR
jgi:hypothetical protein